MLAPYGSHDYVLRVSPFDAQGRGAVSGTERTSLAALPNIENAVTVAETFLQLKPLLQSGDTCSAPPVPVLPSADAALLSAK